MHNLEASGFLNVYRQVFKLNTKAHHYLMSFLCISRFIVSPHTTAIILCLSLIFAQNSIFPYCD